MNRFHIPLLTVLALALGLCSASALARDADRVHARWMANSNGFAAAARASRGITIGFIGCDMHAPGGPEVVLIQLAAGRVDFDAQALRGMPCADGLVRLQSQRLRLGASRVIPGVAATDPDCLAWDIVGPWDS